MPTGDYFYQQIKISKEDVVKNAFQILYDDDPVIFEKYGERGKIKTIEDLNFHLSYLSTAAQLNEPQLFLDYVAWCKMYFNSINFPIKWFLRSLEVLQEVFEQQLSGNEKSQLSEIIRTAVREFENYPTQSNSFLIKDSKSGVLAQQYLNALLRRDRQLAAKIIKDAVSAGVDVKDIYLNVFQLTQYEVGRLWQTNKITVAMEHYCTAATQFIMTNLYEYIFSSEKIGKKLVTSSVAGELHELGIRMVTDFFEIEGWDTYYLGSNTPTDGVIKMIEDTEADLLAISSTIPFNVPTVEELIKEVRKTFDVNTLKILVGGRPFNTNANLWKNIGADGFALNAKDAIIAANKLISLN